MVPASRPVIALGALVMILLAGCGSQPGKSVITYGRGNTPPPAMEASKSGAYALYASNGTTPLYTIHLDRGDEFGFRKASDGKVAAFAREKEIPLESMLATSYYWKVQGDE